MEILSFHPCYEADRNRLCAGRDPDEADRAAIASADAVILPQGCKKPLYDLAVSLCNHVFPNYQARFDYPGKIGQARLFEETGVAHPPTETFASVSALNTRYGHMPGRAAYAFPFVFKFDWGGEGDNVYLVKGPDMFQNLLHQATRYERSGQFGFLVQQFILSRNRALRVVVIGGKIVAYWRVQPDPRAFYANLPKGAVIDHTSDPDLRAAAIMATRFFCQKTGINLAGFDFLFSEKDLAAHLVKPLFLEINFFFGRSGLGGSEVYYRTLNDEIDKWVAALPRP